MLVFLDIFFLVFHTVWTLFLMFGWLVPKLRKLHILIWLITALSWFGAGYFYGWGFCYLTEWHWRVRDAMGQPIGFHSYIQFLVHRISGWAPPLPLTEFMTLAVFILSFVLNLILIKISGPKSSS